MIELNDHDGLIIFEQGEKRGFTYQKLKFIEESSELNQLLIKVINGDELVTEADICQEIAHVHIFLEALEEYYNKDLIQTHLDERLNRIKTQNNEPNK